MGEKAADIPFTTNLLNRLQDNLVGLGLHKIEVSEASSNEAVSLSLELYELSTSESMEKAALDKAISLTAEADKVRPTLEPRWEPRRRYFSIVGPMVREAPREGLSDFEVRRKLLTDYLAGYDRFKKALTDHPEFVQQVATLSLNPIDEIPIWRQYGRTISNAPLLDGRPYDDAGMAAETEDLFMRLDSIAPPNIAGDARKATRIKLYLAARRQEQAA